MAAEDVFVNVVAPTLASSRCVSSTNNQAEPWRKFVIGDLRNLNLYFTDGAGAYVDVSGYGTIRVGVGGINKRPTGGTYTLTGDGGSESFNYNDSDSAFSTAITNATGESLTVEKPSEGVYIVKFMSDGAQTLPTFENNLLDPDSTASVKRLVTGDGSTKEEWIVRLFQVPWAYSESWSNISNGVTGTLNFGTENLFLAMGSADSLSGYFEIELTDSGGNVSTVVQAPVTIAGPVIGDGVAGDASFATYITKSYEAIIVAMGDETTATTTGTAKRTFRMPYAMTLTGVRASVTTAPTGSEETYDINESGGTILSTKLTIDAGETTSEDAATPPVISDTALVDDAEMTFDVDGVGSSTASAGLKIYLIGYRA